MKLYTPKAIAAELKVFPPPFLFLVFVISRSALDKMVKEMPL